MTPSQPIEICEEERAQIRARAQEGDMIWYDPQPQHDTFLVVTPFGTGVEYKASCPAQALEYAHRFKEFSLLSTVHRAKDN